MAQPKKSAQSKEPRPGNQVQLRANRVVSAGSPRSGQAFKLSTAAEFRFDRARGEAAEPATLALDDDQLVVLELENGIKIWTSGALARTEYGTRATGKRSAGGAELEISSTLPIGTPSRGLARWVLKALRIIDVDPIDAVAGKSAALLADKVESQLIGEPGIHPCVAPERYVDKKPVVDSRRLEAIPGAGTEPILVFIHGTASSTSGSFGGLWLPEHRATLEKLFAHYGGRVYGFEHRTLSQSPIQNALDLVKAIPTGAIVHLVSHSRGGIVGELVCRGNAPHGSAPFTDADLKVFAKAAEELESTDAKKALAEDGARLDQLGKLLEQKKIKVERFVRVGCPARGTSLASGRLDRWLSIALNLIERVAARVPIPAVGDTVEVLTELVAAVVKKRLDPSELPGLYAQTPTSPLVRVLNRPGVRTGADLAVIAGDIEGEGFLGTLRDLAANWFFDHDNDLVVDTMSMDGGAERAAALRSMHRDANVNHFSYFVNADSVGKLAIGLTGTEPERRAEFESIQVTPKLMSVRGVRASRSAAANAPIIFVLPGIMGSQLDVAGETIWLDFLKLTGGAIAKLGVDARDVKASALLSDYYGPIVAGLAELGEVHPTPFDWRRSIAEAADDLARQVSGTLDRVGTARPIHFVAHSMGGLVVRTMIARHADLWESVKANADARFVMLGTPNQGSHEIAAMLLGKEKLVQLLAAFDFTHSLTEIQAILKAFVGALQLLPQNAVDYDFFKPEIWKRLLEKSGCPTELAPSANDLKAAADLHAALATSPIDPARMFYIAGCAPATIERFEEHGDKLEFIASAQGDSRVLWRTGIPEALRDANTWYSSVDHGDLTADATTIGACRDLLRSGATVALPKQPPADRAARGTFRHEIQPIQAFPTARDVADAAVGRSRRRVRDAGARVSRSKIAVRITHADLRVARYPLFVGHYEKDPVVSAEAAVDRQLDGRLTVRAELGLYPGEIGSVALFPGNPIDPDGPKPFPGAVILGLGKVGYLSPGDLTRAIRRGLLELASAVGEGRLEAARRPAANGIGISMLAIGCGAGGVGVRESLNAILRAAIGVNDTLRKQQRTAGLEVIGEIELIELFEDQAHALFDHVGRLSRQTEFSEVIELPAQIDEGEGCLRRIRYHEDENWWQRIEITEPVDGARRELRFKMLTDIARTEVSLAASQRSIVDRMIDNATRETSAALSKTLFELLIPNTLKDAAPRNDNLMLLLDKASASYPWELLQDGFQEDSQPVVVRSRVLRQLTLEPGEFRLNPRYATNDSALVIGDTDTQGAGTGEFVELPGAQAEGTVVAGLLHQGGFKVGDGDSAEPLIKAKPFEVLQRLLTGEQRVLHFAAHGVYRYRARPNDAPVTGMVLGDGLYLTADEIEQMRIVPELVFLNCCHLGRIERRTSFSRIAANLATQFIANGARCVVAAGWPVDDAAAKLFAETFYATLLAGESFGEAVVQARRVTYGTFPGVNTWGAYQCYGDPEFKLRARARASGDDNGARFGSPEAMAMELDVLQARASLAETRQARERLLERIRSLEQNVAPRWLTRSGKLCEAFGRAYAAIDDFDAAQRLFDQGMRASKGTASVAMFEQLLNVSARSLAREAMTGRQAKSTELEKRQERLQQRAAELVMLTAAYPTSARYSTLGSTYRRSAIVSASIADARAVKRYLKQSKEAYATANSKLFGRDPYPESQSILSGLLLDWNAPAQLKSIRGALDALDALLDQQVEGSRDFWQQVYRADLALLEALFATASAARGATKRNADDEAKRVAARYLAAFKRGANRQQRQSVFETLAGARALLDGYGSSTPSARIAVALIAAIEAGLQ